MRSKSPLAATAAVAVVAVAVVAIAAAAAEPFADLICDTQAAGFPTEIRPLFSLAAGTLRVSKRSRCAGAELCELRHTEDVYSIRQQ
jgi:hypothetical protein